MPGRGQLTGPAVLKSASGSQASHARPLRHEAEQEVRRATELSCPRRGRGNYLPAGPACRGRQEERGLPKRRADRLRSALQGLLPEGLPAAHRDAEEHRRNTIESRNAMLKNGSYQGAGDVTTRLMRGWAAQMLCMAMAAVGVNLAMLDAAAWSRPNTFQKPTPPPRRSGRKLSARTTLSNGSWATTHHRRRRNNHKPPAEP